MQIASSLSHKILVSVMFPALELVSMSCGSRDSVIGIATHYELDGPGIESRWRRVSYAVGTGSFPGAKRPGRGVDHTHPSSAEVKERVELYLYSPLWAFVACSRVKFTFTSMSCFAHYILSSSRSCRHTSVCFCALAAHY